MRFAIMSKGEFSEISRDFPASTLFEVSVSTTMTLRG
jgi:hypothetical protein